MKLSEIIES